MTMHFEGVVKGLRIHAQGLLQGYLGADAEPSVWMVRFVRHSGQPAERGPVARFLLANGLVPKEPAPAPLCEQGTLRQRPGAQRVGAADRLDHHRRNVPIGTDNATRKMRDRAW